MLISHRQVETTHTDHEIPHKNKIYIDDYIFVIIL